MISEIEKRLSEATETHYPFTYPNAAYHGPTESELTCDGICHIPQPSHLLKLENALFNSDSDGYAMASAGSMQIWRRMVRAVLRWPTMQPKHINGSPLSPVSDSERSSFQWSSPEGAAQAISGMEHPLLSLPLAVCAPLSGVESSGVFHPAWVEEAIGYMSLKAAKVLFKPSIVVTRELPPSSRIRFVRTVTGLSAARVANLSTSGLSGIFYLALHRPEEMNGPARAISSFLNGLAWADEFSVADQGSQWAQLGNMAEPLLGALKLLRGSQPELFDRVIVRYHCCTVKSVCPESATLLLARFYDSTLPAFLDCFKLLSPNSFLKPVRLAGDNFFKRCF